MKFLWKSMALAAAGVLCFLTGCGKETGTKSLRDSLGETLQEIVGAETGKLENIGSALHERRAPGYYDGGTGVSLQNSWIHLSGGEPENTSVLNR